MISEPLAIFRHFHIYRLMVAGVGRGGATVLNKIYENRFRQKHKIFSIHLTEQEKPKVKHLVDGLNYFVVKMH